MSTATAWFTSYRCGCTLMQRDHRHPVYCPYHAPGLTEYGDSTKAARTERLSHPDPIFTEPPTWGLVVENLGAV